MVEVDQVMVIQDDQVMVIQAGPVTQDDQVIHVDQVMVTVIQDDHIMADMVEDGTIDSPEAHGDTHSHEAIHLDVGDSVVGGTTGGTIDGSMTHGGSHTDTADSQATGSTNPFFI